MYWGYNHSLVGIPVIINNIAINKFVHLRQSLGCSDHNTLYQVICTNSAAAIEPTKEVAVDEQLKKFNGRYSNKVKISSKPAGIGVKSYIIGDSNT